MNNPDNNRAAIEEITYVIIKSNGYFYDNVVEMLRDNGFLKHYDFPKVRKW